MTQTMNIQLIINPLKLIHPSLFFIYIRNARKLLFLIIMSKQTTIDTYFKKKFKKTQPKHAPKREQKQTHRNRHNSSRECSEETVRLSDYEPEVKLEVFQQTPKQAVCTYLVLLTPACMLHFDSIKSKLQKLERDYEKEAAMAFIESNMRFHKTENIKNLDLIEDDDFWGLALPKLIQLLLAHLPKLGNIYMLPPEMSRVLRVTRLEALLLVGCMFLGIMPKQAHEEVVSMGELMTLRQNELNPARAEARKAKLRCFMTYIKVMTKNEQLLDQIITIQRTCNRDLSYLQVYNMDREMPLRSVEFQLLQNRAIEDYYGKAIMIDFANKRLGGGVLKNGCVQQEILFAIFPQLLISKLVCPQLEDNQAVIVYGARRFSHYEGYSDSFRFKAEYRLQRQSEVSKSVFVAIDATDFSSFPSQSYQYSKRGVRREIHKAFVGIEGAAMDADENMNVCTGKWGCGAFKGDEELKFLIQWVAVSEASREMTYITDSENRIKEFSLLVRELSHCNTLEILSIIDEYSKFRFNCTTVKMGILEYIKQFT